MGRSPDLWTMERHWPHQIIAKVSLDQLVSVVYGYGPKTSGFAKYFVHKSRTASASSSVMPWACFSVMVDIDDRRHELDLVAKDARAARAVMVAIQTVKAPRTRSVLGKLLWNTARMRAHCMARCQTRAQAEARPHPFLPLSSPLPSSFPFAFSSPSTAFVPAFHGLFFTAEACCASVCWAIRV